MLVGLVLGGRPSRAAGAKGHDVLHRAGIGAAAHHERLAHVAGLFAVCRKQAPDDATVFVHIDQAHLVALPHAQPVGRGGRPHPREHRLARGCHGIADVEIDAHLAPLHCELSRVDREQAAHGVDAGDGGAFVVLHTAAVELSVRERPDKGRAAPPLTRGDGIKVDEDADQLLPSPISA